MSDAERFEAEPPPPPPAGTSTATKILLGCLIGFGVLGLLCCGGIIGVGWWGYSFVKHSVVHDPAEIQALVADVGTIDLPPGLHPEAGVNMHVPFIDHTFVKAVVYTDDHQKQILAIGEFSESFTAVDENRLRDEIDRALTRSEDRDDDDFVVQETHTVDLEIRGQPAKFRIDEGEDKHDRKLIRAFGQFEGHHGVGLLFLQLDAEKYSVEQVEQLLRSIR